MTQTHAKTLKQKHFSMICSTLLLILNMSNFIQFSFILFNNGWCLKSITFLF